MRENLARAIFPPTTVLLLLGCTFFSPAIAYEETPCLVAQAETKNEADEGSAEAADEPSSAAESSEDTADTEPAADDAQSEQELAKELGLTKAAQENPRIVRRSLESILQKSQEAHDRILVDRFLIWVSVLFAMIALMLYLSQPPRRKKKKVEPLKAK
ncbi:MAG: hypothetical protein K2Z81_09315 [Cyanobacteria bacterium]|nr:hypothetical protein [Cyanobacteriota bacterium]